MTMVRARIRLVVAAIAFLVLAAAVVPVAAQQPNSVDPNAAAIKEQQLLQDHYFIRGLGTIPDTKSYVIEQPLGRVWRVVHEIWLHWIGSGLIVGVIVVLALYHLLHGKI